MTSSDSDQTNKTASDVQPLDGQEPTIEELAEIEAEERGGEEETSELELLRAEAALNLDKYQRAVADLANYRRRKEQEVLRTADQTKRALLRQFLPVIDDFERAINAANEDTSGAEWIEGFQLIGRKFWSVLEAEGVRPMEAVGQPFDPSYHEAVEVDQEAGTPDTVIGEHQRGYFLGDEVLRPAMVKVGARQAVVDN